MFLPTIASVMIFVLMLAIFLHHRKRKRASLPLLVTGKSAITATPLTPFGYVLLNGELLPARTIDDSRIEINRQVIIVSARGNYLLIANYETT